MVCLLRRQNIGFWDEICDKILKAMKRPYKIKNVRNIFQEIIKAEPGIKLITDIIIGFPGETEDDFSESLKFVNAIPFTEVRLFEYPEKINTIAKALPNKVPRTIIQKIYENKIIFFFLILFFF